MTTETSGRSALVPWRTVLAVVACVSVFDVTLGLSYPLLSLLLEAQGVRPGVIGANAAMTPLGIIFTAPLVLPLARRLGSWLLVVLCVCVTAAIFVLFKLFTGLAAWFVLRFLLGAAVGILFAVSEAWITGLATPETRGRIMGVYASLLSLGFATGPFLLPFTGTSGWPPFVAGLIFIAAGAIPLLLVRNAAPDFAREEAASIGLFARRGPFLLAAVAAFAIFDTAILALFPLYGLRYGLTESMAAYALGVLIVGNVVLQPIIGWVADRTSRVLVFRCCVLLTVVGGLLLPLVIATPWQWPLLFAWGAVGFGIYTLTLAELSQRFQGALLVAGAAAFGAMWGLGGIAGPPLAGAAMEVLGPDGLPLTLSGVFLVLFFVALVCRRRGGTGGHGRVAGS